MLAITECKVSCVILLDFTFELCMHVPYYPAGVSFIPKLSFLLAF